MAVADYRAAAARQPDHRAVAHWLLFLGASARTDLVSTRRHVDTAVALAGIGQLGHLLGVLHIYNGALLVLSGRPAEGQARCEAVAAQLAEAGAMNGGPIAMIGRFVTGSPEATCPQGCRTRSGCTRRCPARSGTPSSSPSWTPDGTATRGCLGDAPSGAAGPLLAQRNDAARTRRPIHLRQPAAVGRVGGLDNCMLVVGPVDDALGAVAEALGDPAAAGHRRDADELRRELRSQLTAVGL